MLKLEPRSTELQACVRVGTKFVMPMPRVATVSLIHWASARGFRQVAIADVDGPVATFVRNPLDRLISAYEQTVIENPGYWEPGYWDHGLSFDAFVRALVSSPCADIHVRPQCDLLPASTAFICRLESIDDDWVRCCEWLGIEHSPLPHAHRSVRADSYYTPELRAMAAALYAGDFERFGYATTEA